jgi:Enoyl-(Acyl carrier protein) reductase
MEHMPGVMGGKRGLVMGVANDHSIAWGIARMLAREGASLAFTYQGDALGRRVKPLAESVGSTLVLPCDVEQLDTVDAVFSTLAEKWGSLDFLVHAIAFSDKNELKGRYADTSRENFIRTMMISCREGRAGSLGALSGGRLRAVGDPGQCDLGWPDPHACRRRHRRGAADVRVPTETFAATARGDARRDRWRGGLFALRFVEWGHRQYRVRRFRLQHYHHAAAERVAKRR